MSHFGVAVFAKSEYEAERLMAPYQENNMGDCPKEYLRFVEDDESGKDPETGKHGYWENPNAKWDYFRPREWLNTKRGRVFCCEVSELIVSASPSERLNAEKDWEAILRNDKDEMFERGLYFKSEYYIEQFIDKEGYVKEHCGFSPWAFVSPDGKWHEKGAMGWWAINDATHESRAAYHKELSETIQNASPDLMVFVYDCHI